MLCRATLSEIKNLANPGFPLFQSPDFFFHSQPGRPSGEKGDALRASRRICEETSGAKAGSPENEAADCCGAEVIHSSRSAFLDWSHHRNRK